MWCPPRAAGRCSSTSPRAGYTAREAAQRLLERGRVAATAMDGWGPVNGPQHVRLVFANEPLQRLAASGERFTAALG